MNRNYLVIAGIIIFTVGVFIFFKFLDQNQKGPNNMSENQEGTVSAAVDQEEKKVKIATSKGSFTIKLFPQETPKTVENFLRKAQSGFYEGLTFHRVEDWVVQGGDPLGNGTGGGEMATELSQRNFKEGSVGVARGGNIEISNDSQFFVCTKDASWLTGQYTNFGEVLEGMDAVKQIEIGDKIEKMEVLE